MSKVAEKQKMLEEKGFSVSSSAFDQDPIIPLSEQLIIIDECVKKCTSENPALQIVAKEYQYTKTMYIALQMPGRKRKWFGTYDDVAGDTRIWVSHTGAVSINRCNVSSMMDCM